ncbi:aromatic ring-hydroxylating oxygenase subunit alpha [Mycobacteroides chelonae]|uniref:aromatic ring-hydroxylating oxygenase subunit alpha n=1 Tax=Mycobacteroides chelonae TaxID=1774 RepID=UPI0018E29AE0|nr:aromatic ring-hydroxylating dioxygenase subunit alpha [Mycobacteroides chelonae]WED97098.1 aromatic ring-hydroxylating dioxygenase subunit alpha [Mycobacteroides chelonae]
MATDSEIGLFMGCVADLVEDRAPALITVTRVSHLRRTVASHLKCTRKDRTMTATVDREPLAQLDAATIEKQLAAGRVLPPAFYNDESIRRLEDQLIFRHAWQMVCAELDVREPGQYATTEIASVPVVVVRDKERILRAFVNICTHRANPIMTERSGTCRLMQCGYHGWAFGLDGQLTGVPKFAEGNLPPFQTLALRELPVDVFAGVVFVAVEPQESLMEQLGDMPRVMTDAGYDFPFADADSGVQPLAEHTGSYEVDANWKVLVENFNECYHCPPTHPGTFAAALEVGTPDYGLSQAGKFGMFAGLRLRDSMQPKFERSADFTGMPHGFAQFFLWPNTIVMTGCVGEHLMRVEPIGVRTSRLTYLGYQRPGLPAEEVDALYKLLMFEGGMEDKQIMESVQRGLDSGFYEPGPTMAGPELVLSAFQRQVFGSLAPALG